MTQRLQLDWTTPDPRVHLVSLYSSPEGEWVVVLAAGTPARELVWKFFRHQAKELGQALSRGEREVLAWLRQHPSGLLVDNEAASSSLSTEKSADELF